MYNNQIYEPTLHQNVNVSEKNTLGHNINQALKPSINMTKMNVCAWRTKINSKNQAFKSCRYDTAKT